MRAKHSADDPISSSGKLAPQPITVRIPMAIAMLGLSRSKFYELLAQGEFEVIKVGKCSLVLVESLHDFVERSRE